jgi:hypothetical protein
LFYPLTKKFTPKSIRYFQNAYMVITGLIWNSGIILFHFYNVWLGGMLTTSVGVFTSFSTVLINIYLLVLVTRFINPADIHGERVETLQEKYKLAQNGAIFFLVSTLLHLVFEGIRRRLGIFDESAVGSFIDLTMTFQVLWVVRSFKRISEFCVLGLECRTTSTQMESHNAVKTTGTVK